MNTIGRRPTEPTELLQVSDRISFLYLERCVVNRDSNAITATDERGTVHIPAATVGALLLGPGTTVTHQAIALLADSGATVVWVGERGIRYYAHGTSISRSARLLEAQATAVTNTRTRLRIGRAMYAMRFPDDDVSELTMQQLRGREGARVRQIYRQHSERTGIPWTRRQYDTTDWETGDLVNRALSAANSSLYGIVHSVIVALGCSPALGFVHTGHHRSFVYDIADLYKAEITIPTAFDICTGLSDNDTPELDSIVRRHIRDAVHDAKLLTRCAADIHTLLSDNTDETDNAEPEFDIVTLWDERGHTVPGGTGYEEQP